MDASKNYDDVLISKFKKMNEFLTYFKVEKGQENTHTTMGKNAGSYYIPNEYLNKFYELYNRELLSGKSLFLTEDITITNNSWYFYAYKWSQYLFSFCTSNNKRLISI